LRTPNPADAMSDALARARELIATLREQLSTIVLGTAAPDGTPDASVAATLLGADGAFVIYVSGLAAHTRHLRANPRASVLLIDPETTPGNPLARRRLTFACAAEPVARDSTPHAEMVSAFRQKFGATIDVMAPLPDFQFFRLLPQTGRVVAGFGAAFEVNPRDWSDLTPVARGPGRPA
jgi:putative heme iron utilization protein